MARVHDHGLAEIGPIEEGGPMERPLAFHSSFGQQSCDAGDPPAIDGCDDPGDVFVLCGPRSYGSVQVARPAKCPPRKMLQTVGFAFPGIEVLNDLIRRALLPASQ